MIIELTHGTTTLGALRKAIARLIDEEGEEVLERPLYAYDYDGDLHPISSIDTGIDDRVDLNLGNKDDL